MDRSHRRHRNHRTAGLIRIQALHQAGTTITCCLCGQPLDPFQPYNGGRNPAAPSLEHADHLAHGGPILQPNGPDNWAHKLCQDRQGATITNQRRTTRERPNSRNW